MSKGPRSFRDVLYENPGPKTKRAVNIVTAITIVLIAVLIGLAIRLFYLNHQLDARYWSFFFKGTTWQFLGKGLFGTFEGALLAGIMAYIMGFVIMLGRISSVRIVSVISTAIIEFTRGVPTLLFIYFFFLIAPGLGIKLSALMKISLPVAISASGVVAEVLRSGINAVPNGQREAGISLGMRKWQVFMLIIFPQGFRYVIPALVSEIVIVVKDTTYAYVVSYPDMMQNARVLISNYDAMLSMYLVVAVIYILINYFVNLLARTIEERMKKGIVQH